jgi:hypothetical protein
MSTTSEVAIGEGRVRIRRRLWWLLVALWTFALCSPYPIHIRDQLLPPVAGFSLGKTLHFSVYAFLSGTIPWVAVHRWRWWLLGFLSFHGVGTEIIQLFVPDRSGSLTDVGINHLGIIAGAAIGWWLASLGRGIPPSTEMQSPSGSIPAQQ